MVNGDEEYRILSCAELRPGEFIEARINDRLLLRGEVAEIMPSQELLWIREESLGCRRLLDLTEINIYRIQGSTPGL